MESKSEKIKEEKLRARNKTDTIVVHFTGDEETSFKEIRQNHIRKGLIEIGYHYVIEPSGKMLMGRHQSQTGACNPEWDDNSIGICVIGEKDHMTEEQTIAYTLLLDKLRGDYPSLNSIKYVYRKID